MTLKEQLNELQELAQWITDTYQEIEDDTMGMREKVRMYKSTNEFIIGEINNLFKSKTPKATIITGVSYNKNRGKWEARIRINGKKQHLGYFINPIDGGTVYQYALNNKNKFINPKQFRELVKSQL